MNNKIIQITNYIYIIREQKVMLDRDLAELYGIEVRAINQAVKRNKDRFPDDFIFQLNSKELADIKSQNVIKNEISIRKGVMPTVFTEQRPPQSGGRTSCDKNVLRTILAHRCLSLSESSRRRGIHELNPPKHKTTQKARSPTISAKTKTEKPCKPTNFKLLGRILIN